MKLQVAAGGTSTPRPSSCASIVTQAAKATPPPTPAPPEVEEMPKRFGKYTLLRKLAVGGMAELFLALQTSVAGFEKLIVVKRVLPKLAADENFVTMLLDEARIAATLNHPNIAQTFDVGKWEGDYYIAMEHVHGEDLRSIVRQMRHKGVRAFPLEHTLAIILGCCKGLSYAHEKTDLNGAPLKIVHRDVSPQNVLVTFEGNIKLVDFGIAKAATVKEDESQTQLKGKVPYMSPEQAQALPLDCRSDVFSLGVMLFELCTGKRLFRGPNEFETLKLIVEGDYPSPRSINPNLPARLEGIILKALAKDRQQRYQTAREFQADLEDFIRDERLAVSPLSLRGWMQSLFDEKLAQQKQMLQEGRQLAEVIAAQITEEEANTQTGVIPVRPNKTPWVLLGALGLAFAAAAAAAYVFWPSGPPTGPGRLHLESTPPGAAIWIDGERRPERTPADIAELPVGTYDVRLTAEGYVPFARPVELSEAEPTANIHGVLERPSAAHFGVVRLQTTPPGATVLVDGREIEGTTPLNVPELEPGTNHSIAVALDGYVTQSQNVLLDAGEVEELSFTLEETPLGENEARLRLTTDPPTATVSIDGVEQEGTSPYVLRLEAGSRRIVVSRAGYRSSEQRIELPATETTELNVDLERIRGEGRSQMTMVMTPAPSGAPGTLTFDARPWCNVSIDGRSVGQTPIVNRSLPPGRHRIRCTNPELGATENLSVTIESGQATRRRISLQ